MARGTGYTCLITTSFHVTKNEDIFGTKNRSGRECLDMFIKIILGMSSFYQIFRSNLDVLRRGIQVVNVLHLSNIGNPKFIPKLTPACNI